MGRSRRLSASFVRTVKQPGRYGDGHGGYGLSLFVKKLTTGRLSKTWSQRIQINGRVTNLGLGVFPVVTLAEAREQALEHRRAVVQGRDPRGRGIPTFAQAADKVIAIHRATWKPGTKSEQHWRGTLRHHVLPRIGRKRVDQITTADVMGVLLADDFWNRRNATAKRARQRIAAVMKWSVAKGYREDNPAGDAIAAALPKHNGRVQHHRALSHAGVAAALAKVRASSSNPGTQLALELLVLTACQQCRGPRRAVGGDRPQGGHVDDSGRAHEDGQDASGAAVSTGTGSACRGPRACTPLAAGLPGQQGGSAAQRQDVVRARPPARLRAARLPHVVPELVRGDRRAAGGCGAVSSARGQESGGACLRPLGPAGAAARGHGGLERLPPGGRRQWMIRGSLNYAAGSTAGAGR